jgi:hypothetical protein
MTSHRILLLVGAVLFGIAGSAQAAGDITIVRDPRWPRRTRHRFGAGLPRHTPAHQAIVGKFSAVIREASSGEAERLDPARHSITA